MSNATCTSESNCRQNESVLVVDDEPSICWGLERILTSEGHTVECVSSAEAALEAIDQHQPRLIFLDVRLPGEDGLSALPKLLHATQHAPVIVMTAFGDLKTAVHSIQQGASDYITKPFGIPEVQHALRSALSRLNKSTQPPAAPRREAPVLHGRSPAMQAVFKQIALVASSDLAVLITGETGTGKELVANAIHQHSQRSQQTYLPIAPVALNSDVIESELFGHAKGAFTGADHDRAGIFEMANGGTVFLDEIGELPLGTQAKLLRVLDQQQYFRVGEIIPRTCNVRILAATNRDLDQAVQNGTFREDLYYRLNGLSIHLPPLRERQEDIPDLCHYFLQCLNYPHAEKAIDDELTEHLQQLPWRGNVRELKNLVTRAVVLARGRPLSPSDFAPVNTSRKTAEHPSLGPAIHAWFESAVSSVSEEDDDGLIQSLINELDPILIQLAMQHTSGNQSRAAKLLGIHRGTLRQKLRRLPPK